MQSPYFSNINQAQADYSPLVQAGANIGRMYADMGANIGRNLGQAIGAAGSKYFNDKKTERAFAQYIKTQEGGNYLLSHGYSPFDIEEMRANPEKIDKEAMKVVKDIGIDKIRTTFQQQEATRMAEQKHQQATNMYNLAVQEKELVLEDLRQERDLSRYSNDYLAHLNKVAKDGRKNIEQLDPSRGYDMTGEDGKVNPLKVQAVMNMNKTMKLGAYSPQMKVQMMESFKRNDEGGSGKRLESINFKSKTDFNRRWSEFTMNNPDLPNEQVANLKEELRDLIVPEGGVRKIIDNAIEKNQFGAFSETMKTQFGTMARFRSQLDLAFGVIEDYKGQLRRSGRVANPVAASIALMQMARMAQGVGVLSDKDVDRIGGSRAIDATIDRLDQKFRSKKVKLTQKMIEDGGEAYLGNNPDTGKQWEVGDEISLGGAELSTADLTFFEQIADALDGRAKTLVDVVVPQIYEEVRATYGGLTTNEIHEFSDLDIFYPQGFRKEGEVASQVDQRDVDKYHNLLRQGFEPDFIDKNMISDPSFRPEEGDHALLSETRKQALQMFNSDKNTEDTGDTKVTGDTGNNKSGGGEKFVDPNLNDGGTSASVTSGAVSGTATAYGVQQAQNRVQDRATMKSLAEKLPKTAQAMAETDRIVKDGSFDDLKKVAKQNNIDTNKFRGNEQKLRAEVKKKIDAQVKRKLTAFVGKQGFKHGLKKALISGLSGLVSGGAGFTAGSVIYDVIALDEAKDELTIEVIDKTLSQLPDGKEKDALLKERELYFSNLFEKKNQSYRARGMTDFEKRSRQKRKKEYMQANVYMGK